ncbi:MAG: hypothetical protein IKO07_11235 [Clostridia bacterium]|nr:hypothetical protein [Clostridia bacterium]
MLRMLRVEGRRTVQSLALWIIFGVMVVVSFWFSGMTFAKFPEEISAAYGMQYGTATPMSRGEYVFLRTMSDASFTAWLSVIAGALLIGMEFSNRTINHLIYAGNRRISILVVKLLYFYLCTLFLSAVYPVASCFRYSLTWFSGLTQSDVAYVLRCVGCRTLIDMAMMSFALVSAFAFRDVIRTLVCSLIIVVVLSQLMNIVRGVGNGALIKNMIDYFPALTINKIMFRDASVENIRRSMLYSCTMILSTWISCHLFFRKANLK